MHATLLSHLRTLMEYEVWCGVRVIDALSSLPVNVQTDPRAIRLRGVAGHVQLARSIWLARIQGAPFAVTQEWFPDWAAAQTAEATAKADRAWSAWGAGLSESDPPREIRYVSSEGVEYVSALWEIVTHVVNHGSYHRGQLARLTHELGGIRPSTDFVAFSRRRM